MIMDKGIKVSAKTLEQRQIGKGSKLVKLSSKYTKKCSMAQCCYLKSSGKLKYLW